MTEQTVIRMRGVYPAHLPEPFNETQIPPGWTIYHGPGMLSGSPMDGMSCSWPGEPTLLGNHYTAVAPDDPQAAEHREKNLASGAVIIEYVTDEEVRAAVVAYWEQLLEPAAMATFVEGVDADYFWGHYLHLGLHYRREPVPT